MIRASTLLAAACALTLAGAGSQRLAAQPRAESREVRQLVTFRFLPGQTRAALDLYRASLVPIYRAVGEIRTVRMFGEVERPEPLDLMVVTRTHSYLSSASTVRPPLSSVSILSRADG